MGPDTNIVPIPSRRGERRQRAPVAPYVSYKTFKRFLARVVKDGSPTRFEDDFFGDVSGSHIAQLRGTLRYFGLIDEWKRPTAVLNSYLDGTSNERVEMLRSLFDRSYSDVQSLGSEVSESALRSLFEERGLSGTTVQRAVDFYQAMLLDIGKTTSHTQVARDSETRLEPDVVGPVPVGQGTVPSPGMGHSETVSSSADDQRARYVEMLMDLARNSQDDSEVGDLLDRIERTLGIASDS